MECHHRILRNETPGKPCFQCELCFLLEQKPRIGDAIAHLYEVLHGKIGNRVRIDLASPLELRENLRPFRAMTVQQFQQQLQSSNEQFKPCPKNGTMA